jgi:hypothetical protein
MPLWDDMRAGLEALGPAVGLVVVAAVAALAASGAAGAGSPDREQIHITKAGQAAAAAVVLRRSDLGTSTAGWTGGAKKPTLQSSFPCSYHPKQSDLVLNGDAETSWNDGVGLEVNSEAQVLKTPKMVSLDWQRGVVDPRVMPCLQASLTKGLPHGEHLVSFKRMAFPSVATYTRAYRALVDVTSGGQTLRALADVILIGRGRTEVTLTTSTLAALAPTVRLTELRLARLLASRIRP